ncbi:putative T6SS immunity periplasmic lipoprotein [Erwinia tasmaniensis]|uniref:Lipoprotein n=1 Tax=Erwinia tasmaniensis (strain DSM 17950 / CFBP 7177 / CIP 109463 / NCPPB 4357 / Et1/99) TaxID=465817 RepID=B2VJE6_ERWT9|nr:putative T6SS immunity periplasmic lipoprotein [Erwinia tasmaniensis]CAO95671.1 hypothetical protein ETA_06250 [Erwinia tasmaniensis Et1/99]
MKKPVIIPIVALLLTACQLEKPQFERMQVRVNHNQPCFIIPQNAADRHAALTSNGPMVSWFDQQQWQVISPSSVTAEDRAVNAGECTQWPGINWDPGSYNVFMRVNDRASGDIIRYRADFSLLRNQQGELSLGSQ